MKAEITRPDGTVIVLDGAPSEVLEVLKVLADKPNDLPLYVPYYVPYVVPSTQPYVSPYYTVCDGAGFTTASTTFIVDNGDTL